MKIIETKKFRKVAQRYDPRTGQPTDDLGLSPEFSDPANIDYGDDDFNTERTTEEEILSKKQPGIYYSVTGDIPIGPFQSVAEAKRNFEKTITNDTDMEGNEYWKSEMAIFSTDRERVEYLGTYNDTDENIREETGTYFQAIGNSPQSLMDN